MDADDPRHGTNAGYMAHAMTDRQYCDPCRKAHAEYHRQLWRRRYLLGVDSLYVDAAGTRRRIQALQCIGWRFEDIDREAGTNVGWSKNAVKRLRVNIKQATGVAEAFDRLAMTPGPSAKVSTWAKNKGWLPPLAYTDDEIDSPGSFADVRAAQATGLTRWHDFEDRWWSRIDQTESCWLWTGNLDVKGYGVRVGFDGRSVRPHRLSHELFIGPIPEGLVIDHLCRVRNCVNPDHLEAVTQEENTRRGVEARWFEPCSNGHLPEHRRLLPSGKRICMECQRVSDRRRDESHRDSRRAATRARYAKQKGGRGELDPVVVERFLAGDYRIPTSVIERREIVRRWTGTHGELTRLTGWKPERYTSEDVA